MKKMINVIMYVSSNNRRKVAESIRDKICSISVDTDVNEYDLILPGYDVIMNALNISKDKMIVEYKNNADLRDAVAAMSDYMWEDTLRCAGNMIRNIFDLVMSNDTVRPATIVNIITIDNYKAYNTVNTILEGFGMINRSIDIDYYHGDIEDELALSEYANNVAKEVFDEEC